MGLALGSGFYMVLIDTISTPELYAGAGVVLLATVAFTASLQQGFAEAAVRPQWLLRAWRPLLSVPTQIVIVSAEVVRQLFHPQATRGQFRAVPFAGGDAPPDLGRQALTEVFGSLAPNMIVIGIDSERQLLLVHQLRPGGDEASLDVLRLG
jgi:hypothetical protein